jgi:hypothetical protein
MAILSPTLLGPMATEITGHVLPVPIVAIINLPDLNPILHHAQKELEYILKVSSWPGKIFTILFRRS